MPDGVLQYSIMKQFALTNANTCKQICKIKPSYLKCSKETTRFRLQGLENKVLNEHLLPHYLHLNQVVMYQDPTTKRWFPATITKLCQEPTSYIITTKEGVQYRKTQTHLKPYHLQHKIVNSELVSQNNHMWTVKTLNSKQSTTNLAQSRPKRDIRPPIKLDL